MNKFKGITLPNDPPITYRTKALKKLKVLKDALCPRCRKNKKMIDAFHDLMKYMLYEERTND